MCTSASLRANELITNIGSGMQKECLLIIKINQHQMHDWFQFMCSFYLEKKLNLCLFLREF